MSNHRNKQLNDTLRGCKGGVFEDKQGRRAKRARQVAQHRREVEFARSFREL